MLSILFDIFAFSLQNRQYKCVDVEYNVNWKGLIQYLETQNGRADLKAIELQHDCVIKVTQSSETSLPVKMWGNNTVLQDVSFTVEGKRIVLKNADITESGAEVFIVPATPSLNHIGGVRRSVLEKGELIYECFIAWHLSHSFTDQHT